MGDITNLFKATVKTMKSRQKAQGQTFPVDKSILGSSKRKNKSEFSAKSEDVRTMVSQLKEFLLEHRKDYINASSVLGRGSGKMSDAERDQIDAEAETFMRNCSETIRNLRAEALANRVLPQAKEHRDAVLEIMDRYLKGVCRIYSEQRAVRVKRVVDRKKISRLEPEGKKAKLGETFEAHFSKTELDAKKEESADKTDVKESCRPKPGRVPPLIFDDDDDGDVGELSPEEAQMFEQENQQLYDEMNSMVDEVRQIEGKVVEIGRLQEIFSDKVLEQDKDINRVGDIVVGTTENIKDGNEEIREAMKNNAGLRVWILFFLIVCSFSLLFLDWYNP